MFQRPAADCALPAMTCLSFSCIAANPMIWFRLPSRPWPETLLLLLRPLRPPRACGYSCDWRLCPQEVVAMNTSIFINN